MNACCKSSWLCWDSYSSPSSIRSIPIFGTRSGFWKYTMFLSFFIALGPFLLLAARKPSAHRSLIAFTAWFSLAHAAVMTIETVQAWDRGVHRDFKDVVFFALIGLILLALLAPARPTAGKLPKSRLPLELRPEPPA